ncbi:unnamed protein product [Linum trigynum]|uniref:Growth-regulating factor n=2 Tax=Linum trigynum TaxID=586398 RepID=A0AAV2FCL3_9ROSI
MMHVGGGGGGGSFTPSQWMELEHQALIYKYLTSNVPVPHSLLIPIRKALQSAAFSSFVSPGFLRPNTFGWGPFHPGFSSSGDPEPGRCRRTDGKKWRCSRDAVPDQKYCERHINRGRHRSRKPVEVRSGHSVATTNNAVAAAAAKAIPAANTTTIASTAASSVAATSRSYGGSFSNTVLPHHNNDLLASTPLGRMFVNKSNADLKSNENSSFMISKQRHDPYAESSSQTEFGLVSSESLLNPSQKSPSSLISCRSFGSSEDQQQHSLHQFMDNWPKAHHPDGSQLSISIPASHATDFMSSTSSPNNEKEPVQMGLGVANGESQRQAANWIPISWEASMGGPLGEVLQHNTNNKGNNGGGGGGDQCSNNSSLSPTLNLMTEGWDNSLASSPTGVLQRTTFVSRSNSSMGSSPAAEKSNYNKTSEAVSWNSLHCSNSLL